MTLNDTNHEPYAGPNYDHDIFVSYAHGIQPESGGESDLKIWTHALVDKLKENIGYALEDQRRPLAVWYDGKLSKTALLNDTLKQKVQRSATLLIVMTRPYLTSEWCTKELNWFDGELRRRGSGVENVFVVKAMSTDPQCWPSFLKDSEGDTVLGFPFCIDAPGADLTVGTYPYGWINPDKSTTQAQFVESLMSLASAIAIRLNEIRHEQSAMMENNEEAQRNGKFLATTPVFVAPGTEDVLTTVQETRQKLKQEGCILTPEEDIGIRDFTDEMANDAFANAQAFVQCLGLISVRDSGAEIGRVEQLNRRASDMELPCFHLRNKEIPTTVLEYDPGYKQFIDTADKDASASVAEMVEKVIGYLKTQGRMEEERLTAYVEVPAQAISKFDYWKDEIGSDDCLLLPLKAPVRGRVDQIQQERKARQQIYNTCDTVLLLYCIAGQISWLTSAIVNCLKDVTVTGRTSSQTPVPVVLDFIGEAGPVADQIGVAHISWQQRNDTSTLWQRVRKALA